MATITDKRSINATLSTTTVDRAQLLQFWDYIEVYNGEASGGDDVYITDDGATDPVAAAEGTMSVAPGERLVFKARPLTNSIPDGSAVICHEIRVLGNGGLYSVLGLRAAGTVTTLGSGSGTSIANSLIDAKGDLIAATAADTPARLAAGADGTFLVADAASSAGLKYVTLPWRISIPPTAIPSSSTGYTLAVSTNYLYNAVQSGSGINNEATWKVLLAAGTWRLDFFYTKFSSYGIATVSLGGSTVATVDAYAAGATYNNRSSTTGISVTSTGVYDLRFLVDAKNASSSSYTWGLSGIELVRTA